MKKLFNGILACAMLFGITACGEKPAENPNPDTSKIITETTVTGFKGYCIGAGEYFKVGTKMNQPWGAPKEDDDKHWGWLEATSIDAVKEVDESIGNLLAGRKLSALYMMKDIEVGTSALSGSFSVAGELGQEAYVDDAYKLKVIRIAEDDGVDASVWVPSPESGKTESLTPGSWWVNSNYSDKTDKYGRDWSKDSFVMSGAGKYTLVYAHYGEVYNGCANGIAFIKTELLEEAFTPTLHHYQLVGSINGWNPNDKAENVTFNKDDEITYTFAKDDVFKVCKHMVTENEGIKGGWDGSMNWEKVDEKKSTKDVIKDAGPDDHNIQVTKACTLKIAIKDGKIIVTEVTAAAE